MNIIRLLIALALVLLSIQQARPLPLAESQPKIYREFPSKALEVHDGDTVSVREGDVVTRFRFLGIDAPELKQEPWGKRSRDWLEAELASFETIRFTYEPSNDVDMYGRRLVWVWAPTATADVFISMEAIAAGMAKAKYYGRKPRYWQGLVNAQEVARTKARGLWADPSLLDPWEFRRRERSRD